MSNDLNPVELSTIREKLSAVLGIKIPAIALPQTVRNLDKALARLIDATSENFASRIERGTSLREAKTKADLSIIDAARPYLVDAIKKDKALAQRALEFTFSESVLK
jgi:hypothetical protein